MGIRFYCPNGHKLNVKEFQAGRKGICPFCGAKIQIPTQSTRRSSKEEKAARRSGGGADAGLQTAGAATALAVPDPLVGGTAWPASGPFQPVAGQPAPWAAAPFPSAPAQPAERASPLGGGFPSSPAPIESAPIQSAPIQSAPAQPAPLQSAPQPTPLPAAAAPTMPTAADPLSEAGDAVWYVRPPSGGQFGPAGRDIMRQWLGEGRISADALVWREGWRDWQTAGQVFSQLAGQGLQAFQGVGPAAASSRGVVASGYRPAAKRQSKTTQLVIIGALIVAVLVLLTVFVVILLSGDKKTAGVGLPWGTGISPVQAAATAAPQRALASDQTPWPLTSRSDHEDTAVPSAPRNCVQSVCG